MPTTIDADQRATAASAKYHQWGCRSSASVSLSLSSFFGYGMAATVPRNRSKGEPVRRTSLDGLLDEHSTGSTAASGGRHHAVAARRRHRRRPARARPGCSPVASPTASPPATADARHTLALTFTREAAGELRRRLRRLGPPRAGRGRHVPRGGARRLLRQRWADRDRRPPTVVGDRRAAAGRGRRRRRPLADARRRDRLGRGARPRAPTAYAAAAAAQPATAAAPGTDGMRRRVRRLRDAQAPARRGRLRRPARAARPRAAQYDPTCGRRRAVALPPRARRRGAGPQPAAAPAARAAARRARRPVPRRRPGAGDLRLQRRRSRACCVDVGDPHARRRGHPAADEPPLHAADRRGRRGTSSTCRRSSRRRVASAAATARPWRSSAPTTRTTRRRSSPRSSAACDPRVVRTGAVARAGPHERPGRPGSAGPWRRRRADPRARTLAPGSPLGRRRPARSTALPSASAAAGVGPRHARGRIPGDAGRSERHRRAPDGRPPCSSSSASQPFGDGAALRTWIATTNPFAEPDAVVGVEVLTFHAAKGREWHTVVRRPGSRRAWCRTARRRRPRPAPRRPGCCTSP